MMNILRLATTIIALVATSASVATLQAQSPDVRPFLKQIANGWTADAKKALPDLLVDHPSDPAVMFLHASLVDEPMRALPLYERIAEAFAKSDWADDALMRIILLSAPRRDTVRARKALAQLRDAYPNSELLAVAADAVRMSVGLPLPTERKTATTKEAPPSPPTVAAAKVPPVGGTATTDADATKRFGIQVGSYSTAKQAEAMAAAFRKSRMKATTSTKKIGNATQYGIMVGDYADEATAQSDVATVRSICKCKAFVVAK
jgi:cell division septation protein DedD